MSPDKSNDKITWENHFVTTVTLEDPSSIKELFKLETGTSLLGLTDEGEKYRVTVHENDIEVSKKVKDGIRKAYFDRQGRYDGEIFEKAEK